MSRAQDGSLAAGQGGLQEFPSADIDQAAQWPRAPPQPSYVNGLARGGPEPFPSQPLRSDSVQPVSQHVLQIARQFQALGGLARVEPVPTAASKAVANSGRQE